MQDDDLHNASEQLQENSYDKVHQKNETTQYSSQKSSNEEDEFLKSIDFFSGVIWKGTDQSILDVEMFVQGEDTQDTKLHQDIQTYQEVEMQEEEWFRDMDFLAHVDFFKDALTYHNVTETRTQKRSIKDRSYKFKWIRNLYKFKEIAKNRRYIVAGVAILFLSSILLAWGVSRMTQSQIALASDRENGVIIWPVIQEEPQLVSSQQMKEKVEESLPVEEEVVDMESNTSEDSSENQQDGGRGESIPTHNNRDNSYFDDAIFIGNSRTVGLRDMTGLSNATFMAIQSLNVNTARNKAFVTEKNSTSKVTIVKALEEIKCRKIYLNFGINELGWESEKSFQIRYKELVEKIKEIQPNANIYVQSIIPVTKEKSEKDSWINNFRISLYNNLIEEMCEELQVTYLDVARGLVDESGALPSEATVDGVHLNRKYCNLWLEQIRNLS